MGSLQLTSSYLLLASHYSQLDWMNKRCMGELGLDKNNLVGELRHAQLMLP